MGTNMLGRINELRQMTVSELQSEWLRLYGEPSRSRNRDYLWKRLAWRIQELEHGGLSDRAKQRIDELAPDAFIRARTPSTAPGRENAPSRVERPRRDPRMPSPGTVITKTYRGRELRIIVRDDGFELDGAMYPTATALAKAITGCRSINGKLFLGLTMLGGIIFLGVQAYEWTHLITHGLNVSGNPMGATFYALTGFHGAHVFSGVVYLFFIWLGTLKGKYGPDNAVKIEIVGLFWHFVDLVWIIVFTVVYLI